MPKCGFLQCPNEIIFQIGSYLGLKHIYALLQTSHDLHDALRNLFYDRVADYCRADELTMLEWAAQEGYLNVIRELQSRGREKTVMCGSKDVAICLAAANGHLSCIEPLIAMGAEVSQYPYNHHVQRYSPLMWAAKNGNLAMVKLLISKGARTDTRSPQYLTALEYALIYHHGSCVRYILEKSSGAELSTYLNRAARSNHLSFVQQLLDKGADIDAKDEQDGKTVVQYAVLSYNCKCLRILFAYGERHRPEILLHISIINGDEGILRRALHLGANPLETKYAGNTAYQEAVINRQRGILRALLKYSVEHHATNKNIALYYAAHVGDDEIVRLLLAKGANASAPDKAGFRPLHYAVGAWSKHFDDRYYLIENRLRIIRMLLEKGARVSDANHRGYTALKYAKSWSCTRIIRLLEQKEDEESYVS
ncbi:ankyrin repeat domain-containing protein [Aspergillus ruber CBS 135680]|uniref:Ankyrin n=1 Tax=Aspergillus ruber (strain CBS 135680) TaxID=1388766 RepID=A0A017S0M6_ASPRC|nr:ankyrin [Aspergillus ruber CBS 135680]EYE90174.1 ankyrin [Aspergillus ruber CBS 135680]